MLSIGRRMERYRVIYVRKTLNCDAPILNLIRKPRESRRGTLLQIPANKTGKTKYRSIKERSMAVNGAKLFNAMPITLRANKGNMDDFKQELDSFLETIPDVPGGLGGDTLCLNLQTLKPSNSLCDWTRKLQCSNWIPKLRKGAGEANPLQNENSQINS